MRARLDRCAWRPAIGPYAALGFSFAVRAMDAATIDYLAASLAPLSCRSPARYTYSIVDRGERRRARYAIYLDGKHIVSSGAAATAAMYLLWHINLSVVRESPEYLLFHASGAALQGAAMVFPAPPESGKTTLVAGLLQRGLSYLTDEAVAIDPSSGLAHPYPKSLSVDWGSWDVLPDLRPTVDPQLAPFAAVQWQVDPRTIGPGIISSPCPVAFVISPRFEQGAVTRLEPISRAQGALLLVTNAFNFDRHGAAGLDAIAKTVRRAQCYRLVLGCLSEACDAVLALTA